MNRATYERYIGSDRWRLRRERFFATHPRVCSCCESEDDVQVHHLTYVRFGDELDDDLLALCQRCHSLVHQHHRLHGGDLRAATFAAIKSLQAQAALRVKRESREFVPRNQRGAQRDPEGRLLSRLDWRTEARGLHH